MKNITDNLTMTDVIGILMIAGYIFLVALGEGKDMMPAILLIVGYYFGKKGAIIENAKKNDQV